MLIWKTGIELLALLKMEKDSKLEDGDSKSLVTQYVESIVDFSSQYGTDTSISYTASNLAGKPSIYPAYGDFTLAFVLRTYGTWWESSPCAPQPFKEMGHHRYASQDFVELKFEKKVNPLKINIYETYNPGAVIRILACDTTTFRWVVIWSGEPIQTRHSKAHIFSPSLKMVEFSTDLIRIEFYHRHLEYYAELDAVMLTGVEELSNQPEANLHGLQVLSKSPEQAGLNAICSQIENLPLSVIPSFKPPAVLNTKDRILQHQQKDHLRYFELLPSEVIFQILGNLDLQSLCRVACTCRELHKQCYYSLLYMELDFQPYWYKVTSETLLGLQTRCSNIERLNLSWCGNYGRLSTESVIDFLKTCGGNLLCIRLSNCKFVTNDVLEALADFTPDLEELDLKGCQTAQLNYAGFRHISRLTKLKRLNLYRTLIDLQSLGRIIRSCPGLEVLDIGACYAITNFDEVALDIGRYCRHLRGLDLWRAKSLTAFGVRAIANCCPQLEELDLGWCIEVSSSSGCIIALVEKCCRLKKLFLTALRTICDNDILAIARYCPHLEQLDILGTRDVSALSLPRLLISCQKLKLLDLSFCGQIDCATYQHCKQTFPHIDIKKSFLDSR